MPTYSNPSQPSDPQRYRSADGRSYYYDTARSTWVEDTRPAPAHRVFDKRTTFIVGLGLLAAIALLITIALVNRSDGPATTGTSPYTQTYLTGPDAFIAEVEEAGLGHVDGESALLRSGYIVCDVLDEGYSGAQAAEQLYYVADLTEHEAKIFVNAAVDYLC